MLLGVGQLLDVLRRQGLRLLDQLRHAVVHVLVVGLRSLLLGLGLELVRLQLLLGHDQLLLGGLNLSDGLAGSLSGAGDGLLVAGLQLGELLLVGRGQRRELCLERVQRGGVGLGVLGGVELGLGRELLHLFQRELLA